MIPRKRALQLTVLVSLYLCSMPIVSAAVDIIEFINTSTSITLPYDEGISASTTQSFQISTSKLPKTTDIQVMFSKGGSAVFSPRIAKDSNLNQITYQLYDNLTNRIILKDTSDGPITDGFIQDTLPRGVGTYSYSYAIEVPSGQFVAAGTYSDTFIMYIYVVEANGALTLMDSISVQLVINVASTLKVAIGSTGFLFDQNSTQYTLDFGSLELLETLTCDTIVRSNVPYALQISSLYDGVMKLTSYPTDPSQVGYAIFFNGSPSAVDLSTPATLVSNPSITTSAGQRFPLSVQITEVNWPAAGTYSDSITLTLIAN